ncbi:MULTISPECIES: prephenate dehydratase [unclassified Coleofasciculus]|uniref:prephenate dehydratase n=1 Tax=unclassified Coleofasciculus TaxID=2692782 RepID=UPI0018811514|nr:MULTISPECIES: prephenate dehydratase [unclassified Coleofasciculus]MBE9125718.1 prephenate dehydratase [Coleofasciculus sp. LEGE 07081]MBE9148328.1 prephenate dehydratase [Coleofasciculus sp. LEGE 07092]
MSVSIAHLGPPGTYAEAAALAYRRELASTTGKPSLLCPYPSIAQTLRAVAQEQAHLAVVPVENSIEGSVTITLDTLWQLHGLQIQQALVLPIEHALLSRAAALESIQTVYSHPQALAQCQRWLETSLPSVQLVPTNSTTEALKHLDTDHTAGVITSQRAARLYNVPILASNINDYPDNCTRFWVVGKQSSPGGSYTSLAFSTPANVPGALAKLLQVFANRGINLSRIESRPTKRSLGEYLFFIDLEADASISSVQATLSELASHTEILKIFGSYNVLPINSTALVEE